VRSASSGRHRHQHPDSRCERVDLALDLTAPPLHRIPHQASATHTDISQPPLPARRSGNHRRRDVLNYESRVAKLVTRAGCISLSCRCSHSTV
jgi:hypothetical protein